MGMQTAISRALSPSPSHSGSADEFSFDPEISGDESDTETRERKTDKMDDVDEPPSANISRN
jgi:hypothetical protein